MIRAATLFAFALFWLALSSGTSTQDDVRIYGEGNRSCGEWVLTIGSDRQDQRLERIVMSSWARGYVTAAAAYTQNLRETDAAAIEVFIDGYCRQYPLAPLFHATIALALELRK